ncbi:hypothetical protein CIW50_21935 [Tardiphaga sp. P9-11]|jgi:hypothetical protein|nr:hypothetical protein CIW50_21935 [Tardiphaga sp. P9-11]
MFGHRYSAQLQPAKRFPLILRLKLALLLRDCFSGKTTLTAFRNRNLVICQTSGGVSFDFDIHLRIDIF